MSHLIEVYLPYVMSAITIYTMFLAGNKSQQTWIIGLVNQVFWFTWIFTIKAYGLLPMTIALTFVYCRNHLKWRKENKNTIR